MDIKYFEDIWNKKKTNKGAQQVFWDCRAEEFNEKAHKNEGKNRLNRIIELLESKSILTKDSNILDIGCGPGKYAIEFAKRSNSVTGIDISPKMIGYAWENLRQEGLTNASFEIADWEETDLKARGWEKKYDLVFASMSPAINSRPALEKMINASKNYCFLSTFVEREDAVKDHLGSLIDGQNGKKEYGKTIYCSFNILWLMGFHPEITYIDTEWENVMTFEKAYQYYRSHLEMMHTISSEKRILITDYLREVQENGMIKEKVKSKIAWMYWKVS